MKQLRQLFYKQNQWLVLLGGLLLLMTSIFFALAIDYEAITLIYIAWIYLIFCTAIQLACGQRWFLKEAPKQGLVFTLPVQQKNYTKTYLQFLGWVFLSNLMMCLIVFLFWILYGEGPISEIVMFTALLLCGVTFSQYLLLLYFSGRMKRLWSMVAGLVSTAVIMGVLQLFVYGSGFLYTPYVVVPPAVLALGLYLNYREMKRFELAKNA